MEHITPHHVGLATLILTMYLTPGPATMTLAASGAAQGFGASLRYFTGLMLGMAVNLTVAGAGLTWLFGRWPVFETVFMWLASGYLVYMAARMMARPTGEAARRETTFRFFDGMVLNFVNPKGYAAAAAVMSLGSRTLGIDSAWEVTLLLGGIFTLVIFTNLGWLAAGALLGRLATSPERARALNTIFALALLGSVAIVLSP